MVSSTNRDHEKTAERAFLLLVCLAIFLAVGMTYAQTFHFGFVDFDDGLYVTDRPRVHAGLTVDNVIWAFTNLSAFNWHPLTWLSYMADVSLFGLDAGWLHLTNAAIHGMNSLLLLLVLVRCTGDIRKCAVIAAIFALHPLHVESVAWISERKDVISGTFWILTMGAYAGYVRSPTCNRYFLLSAVFALGLMAKPTLVTLPFILLLMDYWPFFRLHPGRFRPRPAGGAPSGTGGSILMRRLTEKWPLLLMAAAVSCLTLVAQKSGGAVAPLSQFTPAVRVSNALYAYGWYLWKMFFPFHLAAFYPHSGNPGLWRPLASLVAMGLVTMWSWSHRHRHPAVWVGWLWFVISLFPVIGLIQVGEQAFADRYMYLPMIGLSIALVWFPYERICSAWRNENVRVLTVAGAVIYLFWLAYPQVGTWSSSQSMARQALSVTRGNYLMHTILGNVWAKRGKIELARGQYDEAIRIKPDFEEAYSQKGRLLMKMGRPDEAEPLFRRAIGINPRYTDAYLNLANLLSAQGRYRDAIGYYRTALEQQPDLIWAYQGMAAAYYSLGEYPKAVEQLKSTLAIDPGFIAAHMNLGRILAEQGDYASAFHHYGKVLDAGTERSGIYFNIANLFFSVNRLNEAIAFYRKHLQQAPMDPAAYNNLGMVWLKKGDMDRACRAFWAAHALAPSEKVYRQNLRHLNRSRGRQQLESCGR